MKKTILGIALIGVSLGMHAQTSEKIVTSETTNGLTDFIYKGGNVGIGTSSPNSKLDVRLGGWNNFARITFAQELDHPSIRLYRPSGNGNIAYSWWIENNRDLSFKTGSPTDVGIENVNSIMTLHRNGNVGIGTSTPDSKLAVNGNIHAKEVKVDLIDWPDYVFAKEYNLPTLKEVETHIKEKGHLADIPSAAVVAKEGFYIGDMNAKLLQKIEELTLYTIEQEKKINELEKLKFLVAKMQSDLESLKK